jgi:hypothetical protein
MARRRTERCKRDGREGSAEEPSDVKEWAPRDDVKEKEMVERGTEGP